MSKATRVPIPSRRRFLHRSLAGGLIATSGIVQRMARGASPTQLMVGQGVVDTTPPMGIELAGFHLPEDKRRKITGIRQPTAARALVLRLGETLVAIVSVDIIAFSREMTARVQKNVEAATGIPAKHVRLCATHTHSMPSFQFLRQWGEVPADYMASVEGKIVEAVRLAKEDLASAEMSVGKARAVGGNSNRTAPSWKTDADYTLDATDEQRWLDTAVHVVRFDQAGRNKPLLWYHFSAHTVCYGDTLAGPDWAGHVATLVKESDGVTPSFLQGHAGDVNPGDGKAWIGDPNATAAAVHKAVREANAGAKTVKVGSLVVKTGSVDVPLDIPEVKLQMEQYRKDPAACASGVWVDAGFAKDWFDAASKWDLKRTALPTEISAMRIGELGMVFHPAELFSVYGLEIRHRSPLPNTIVVGYTDGIIGYVADPNRYKEHGYEAAVVPKILDIPPFTPTAGREFTKGAVKLAIDCFA